jgi:virulence-associated protein VagC
MREIGVAGDNCEIVASGSRAVLKPPSQRIELVGVERGNEDIYVDVR